MLIMPFSWARADRAGGQTSDEQKLCQQAPIKSLPARSVTCERTSTTSGSTYPVQDQGSLNSGVRPARQRPAPSCTNNADAMFTVNSTSPPLRKDLRLKDDLEHADRALRRPSRRPHPMNIIMPGYKDSDRPRSSASRTQALSWSRSLSLRTSATRRSTSLRQCAMKSASSLKRPSKRPNEGPL